MRGGSGGSARVPLLGWGGRGRQRRSRANAELVVEHMQREQLPGHKGGRLLVAQNGAFHVVLTREEADIGPRNCD